MKVREAIKRLSKLPPDADLMVWQMRWFRVDDFALEEYTNDPPRVVIYPEPKEKS